MNLRLITIRDVDYSLYVASPIYLSKISKIIELSADRQEVSLTLLKEVGELIKEVFVPTIPDSLINMTDSGFPVIILTPNELVLICVEIAIAYCEELQDSEEMDKKQKKIYKDQIANLELYKQEILKVLGKKKDRQKEKIPVAVE